MSATSKLAAKRAFGRLYSLRPRPAQRKIVLLYHSIGNSPLALKEAAFRSQIEWLSSVTKIVPLTKLLISSEAAPLQVSITFDDGYASLYAKALPTLSEFGATAAAFLNTGWIAGETRRRSDAAIGHYPREEFLLWREVEDLAAAGWEIGSHGVDHLDLTVQPLDTVRSQLCASRARIDQMLGACSPVFSYTWGRHTEPLRQLVAEAGYTHAVSGLYGALTEKTDPLAIPRIDIAKGYSLSDFKAIVRGDWDYLSWVQRTKARKRASW
jgi:peptidoglycan/xylan/chitin deacetylase (PgdA/CDA1 family)